MSQIVLDLRTEFDAKCEHRFRVSHPGLPDTCWICGEELPEESAIVPALKIPVALEVSPRS
jgi:hypothetical protein